VVVSDGRGVLVDVDHAGDEPFMAAGKVPGAAVLVCASRYTAGRFAESRLGCTVHILDDGFQHFDLLRDVDLLVAPDPRGDMRTLPAGRLREPIDAARSADALLVELTSELSATSCERSADSWELIADSCKATAERLGVPVAFGFVRRIKGAASTDPAFAFAGIARPERFFGDLEAGGWQLVGRRSFRDHHPYSRHDLAALTEAARRAGAKVLVTTEKDSARMRHLGPLDLPVVDVPLEISLEPRFAEWLGDRLRSARSA
jgi:tetraacyldisaccharide 4'-kinase